ncbi:hypothetical protein [Kibdelosporangium phytohabitans]|uniref:Secreted protein n=1 Tax=Kibdelosporangium phytohabitans TaxID=860235 RepID=A0A0N9HZ11_9PSEU|nr:hypothetical protein [Kibdelosporangium phytohabitans]ALG10881.1 hypothetical protein AOZ06_31920 [Kibdelosporangium phytohabitans]MBE1462066.1 hypothetical protein [Kibdelosporangium phytohabitans]
MFFRLVLGVSVALIVVAAPASAHVVSAGADLHVAQTVNGAELTVVIRRTPEVPGPLYVDLVAYQPVRDLSIDLAVGDSTAAVLLQRDRPGTYPAVLHVRDQGQHELVIKTSDEFSVVPFRVAVPSLATWELAVYGGFGATGLLLAAAIVAGAMSRRATAMTLGGVGVIAMTIAATVAVVSPQLSQATPEPGRPNAQALLTTSPSGPVLGEPFTVGFDLVDGSTGLPVDDLAVHHDAIAHLVITSQDGQFFRHLHPLRTKAGRVEARVTADRPGKYLAYLDIERVAAGGQLVSGTFEVTGPPRPVSAQSRSLTFPAARPVTIEVDTGSTGLQSWLGMPGHLITRDHDGGFLGHAHERSMSSTSDGTVAGHGPRLRFATSFPRPGRYFAWVQYVRDFRVVTVPHVVEVVG